MRIFQIARVASAWLVARANVKSERGATAVEYGIMVALIAAVIIAAVVFLGNETSETFSCVGGAVADKGAGGDC